MALGRRGSRQKSMWVSNQELPRSAGHPFYTALEGQLCEAGFDAFVEDLCAPFYAKKQGRPSIPPGIYFRMLFVGYFEGLDSQRGIAWRCQDSLSIREFLGLEPEERSPDHSSMTVIRQRLPFEVFEQVFRFVLRCCADHGLLKGNTVAVDATFLEANAAMSSIVRRDTGEGWRDYIRRLAEEDGVLGRGCPALGPEAQEEGRQRRMRVEDGSGQPHREDEGRPDPPGVQGRARGGPGQ